jgi:hypothetical protein
MTDRQPDESAPQGGTIERRIRDHGRWTRDPTTGSRLVWKDLTADDRCDLRDADLSGAVLRSAILCGADLNDADLRYAHLRGADLHGAVLRYAVLSGADLRYAHLRGADLRGAVLRGAVLHGAVLRFADLNDADLRYAHLRGADLRDAALRGTGVAIFQASYSAILVPSDDPQDPVLQYGCERHPLSHWREHVRELCELHEAADADRYEREIRALIALCEAIPPPTVFQGER